MAALIVGKNRKFLLSGLRGVAQHHRFAHSSVGEAHGPLLLPASVGGAFAGSAKPNKEVVVQSTMLMQGMPTIAKLSLVDDTVQVFSSLPILCKGGSGGGRHGGGGDSSDSDSDDVHKHHNPKTVNRKAEIAEEQKKREADFDDYPIFQIECLLDDLLSPGGGCDDVIAGNVATQIHAWAVTRGVFNFMGPRARKLKIDLASLYGSSIPRVKVLKHSKINWSQANSAI